MNDDKNGWWDMEKELEKTADASKSALPSCPDACPDGEYKGMSCACADCHHEEGVCISHDSGSGCAACDGPTSGCDLVNYE